MLIALLLTPAHAWLGTDGQYNYSESGSTDADAPPVAFYDITVEPTAVNLSISNSDDNATSLAGIALAPVNFYNTTYVPGDIFVSTNGVVVFDSTQQNGSSNYCCTGNPIPASSPSMPAIFPFWTDLNPGSSGSIWVFDDLDTLYIQYEAVAFYGGPGTANTAQVQLQRSTGQIRITVDEQIGTDQVSIGIQNDFFTGLQAYEGPTPMIGITAPVTWLFTPDETDDDGDGYAGIDDCNDFDPAINPDAVEICDGQDNDCNGGVDEAGTIGIWYIDNDNDNWGDINGDSVTDGCFPPEGYAQAGDCDDNDSSVRPNAIENCDPIDRNCDGDLYAGAIDTVPYQVDADGDGYGVSPTTFVCELPADAATEGTGDCDDTRADVYPGADEINFDGGVDNNCDGRESDDRDDDGMNDPDEYAYGSDWLNPDTDGDGVLDGSEFAVGGNLLLADTDGDGLSDALEMRNGPMDHDGDGDYDINDYDDDNDGYLTLQEGGPDDDFDGDGTPDYLDLDSDNDGIPDSEESPASRLRVDTVPEEDAEKGCGCSSSTGAPGAGLLLLPLAVLGLRRRH